MANSVDPNEMAHYMLSHLDLYCLHRYLFWSAGLNDRDLVRFFLFNLPFWIVVVLLEVMAVMLEVVVLAASGVAPKV